MVDKSHTIGSNWREADAIALEARVAAVGDSLDHVEDLVNLFKEDERIASELRSLAGTLRTRRNDFSSAAERLRAELKENEKPK